MSNGTQLKLDRQHMIQMVKSPEFYLAVPAFVYLKDAALTSAKMLAAKADCAKCHNEWKMMQGPVDALFIKLAEMKRTGDRESLSEVKAFLSKRKGYTVSSVVIYYRRSRKQGKIAKLVF